MKRKSFVNFIVLIAVVLLGYTALLIFFENRVIYYPSPFPEGIWDAKSQGLEVEDVYFKTDDGLRLHGWYVPALTPVSIPIQKPSATFLFFHGNAGNITHRLDNLQLLRERGWNVFIFDYRGYGKSEGRPTEKGIYLDSLAAYEFLRKDKNVPAERLFLFGRSLGGVCAVHVAASRPAAGVILESTFTSARDMAGEMFPILPVGPFIRTKFDSFQKISTVKIPKLFLHAPKDSIVPYSLGRKLFERAPEPKSFYDIIGADHNDAIYTGGEKYFQAIEDFVSGTVK